MSAAIHIPPTRRSNPVFSQRHHHPNQPSPPISESMVRERLSANLPDSFNYLSNTRAVGRSHRPHSSSSSGAGSDRSATPPARTVRSGPGNERRSRPPHTFTRGSSSSSSCSSRSSSTSSDGGERYSFYARLAKIHRGGEPAALARCCDTVRGTLQLLKQAQLCTGDSDGAAGFFWLDLHGVPPPPRRGRAALRDADSGDAPMSALWRALGLQASTVHTFTTVCEQRQARPRPARTLLDDVYEEEVVDFSCPDDRVLQVGPLRAPASAEPAMGVCDTGRCPEECVQLMHEQDSTAKRTPRDGVAGSAHYVALELATLLTPVHASAATMREAAWETALSPAPSAEEHANEPLNNLVWAGSLGRSMLSLPAAAAAIGRPAPPVLPAGLCQATQPSPHSQEPPAAAPLITSTYVVCFPAGCVTWCPASTLGLTSADRRAHRSAAAAEVQCVKSWEQLQTAVLRRMWHATHLSRGAAAFPPHARCGAALSFHWPLCGHRGICI